MKSISQKDTAAIIRRDIKAAFPTQKFSVTCGTGSMVSTVHVRWEDGVSERAVQEFLTRYTCTRYDSMEECYRYNTVTYQGEEVQFYGDPDAYRRVSTELWQQACKVVGCDYQKDFLDGHIYDHNRRAVLDLVKNTDAATIYAMTSESYQAALWEKSEAERKAYEAQELEREGQAKVWQARRDALEVEMATVKPISIEATDYRTLAMFAKLNKRNNLEEYRQECADPDGFNTDAVRVLKVITLTPEHYDIFADTLMESWDFLTVGGNGSDWEPTREASSWHDLTPEEQEQYLALGYREVQLIRAEGRQPFVVDTQGFTYARYVGLQCGALLELPSIQEEAEKRSELKLACKPATPVSPGEPLKTRLAEVQAKHSQLVGLMMEAFANFTQEGGAARLADLSAQVAGAEELTATLRAQLELMSKPTCKPTTGAWQIMASAAPTYTRSLN